MAGKYALVIGNSRYEDSALARLKTPDADVHALATALRDPTIGGFDEVQELLNQPETNVRRAISTFFEGKKPDDLLLMYFSGHGVLDSQGRLFLAVQDTQRKLLRATSIPSAFITDEMDSSRSKRQVLILDCCHSGAFARGSKGDTAAITRNTFEGNGFGRVVLTASDSTQYALEGDQLDQTISLSLFTNFLLEGLKTGGADRGGDGWIAVDEWYDYAYERVLSHTPNQTPKKWAYNTQGDLVIARNVNPIITKPVELPSYLLTALKSELPRVRMEAIEELGSILHGQSKELAGAADHQLQHMLEQDDSSRVRSRASELLEQSPFRSESALPQVLQVPVTSQQSLEVTGTAGSTAFASVPQVVPAQTTTVPAVDQSPHSERMQTLRKILLPVAITAITFTAAWYLVVIFLLEYDFEINFSTVGIPSLIIAAGFAASLYFSGLPITRLTIGLLFFLWFAVQVLLLIYNIDNSGGELWNQFLIEFFLYVISALLLKWSLPRSNWLVILASWSGAWVVAMLAVVVIGYINDPSADSYIDIYCSCFKLQYATGGLFFGLIGSGVMYWHLKKIELSASTSSQNA